MIYVLLNEDNFVDGWSSSYMENSIEVEKDVVKELMDNNFMSHRYDKETGNFILDESNLLAQMKASKLIDMNENLLQRNRDGFIVNLGGESLRYQNTESNKTFLQKAYTMQQGGLIDSTTLKFIDLNGNETTRLVEGQNIFEVWVLSFLHEDELNKYFNEEILPSVDKAKTIAELNEITW